MALIEQEDTGSHPDRVLCANVQGSDGEFPRLPLARHGRPTGIDIIFTIRLGDRILNFSPDQFIHACWSGGLDTPCSLCEKPFDISNAPPVRWICLAHPDRKVPPPDAATLPVLCIVNSHLKCLKAHHIQYYPISHTWHPKIADAYASRISNPEAARIVYETPARILLAAAHRFGPKVRIWHDYISIPQWQDRFRGTTILPQIFQVFRYGGCSIIHLDDEPAVEILDAYTPENLAAQVFALQRLFACRWFKRMWPVIEYYVCREAYVLNNRYEIMPNTFTASVKQIADCRWIAPYSDDIVQLQTKLTNMIPLFVREKPKTHRCLGYIYDVTGDQGCRDYRDRFIAVCALLEKEQVYSQILSRLPQDSQEACAWISRRCLSNNDISPLLLLPSFEDRYESARWLKGHTSMNSNMWRWGIQTESASSSPVLEGNNVQLKLDRVGRVIWSKTWMVTEYQTRTQNQRIGNCQLSPVKHDLHSLLILLITITTRSIPKLHRFLHLLYPSELLWAQQDNEICTFPAISYGHPSLSSIEEQANTLIKQYTSLEHPNEATISRTTILTKLATLFGLLDPPTFTSPSSHLFHSVTRASLVTSLDTPSPHENAILLTRCDTCYTEHIYRCTVFHPFPDSEVESSVYLYRVPGLAYQHTLPGGVGMLVDTKGEIVGRTRYIAEGAMCTCAVGVTVVVAA